ncbi:hypothetical protein BB561_001142 [Smittium simulii]|uniref:Uncharacterized protein n=1 Tax=Smittium simulii TaxID=133385 RepID=A0A2T9YVW5_9FUNG|nr:hypothetical protein BB561_001142 [Smittium simulii]
MTLQTGQDIHVQNRLSVEERLLKKIITTYIDVFKAHQQDSSSLFDSQLSDLDNIHIELLSFKHFIFKNSKIYENELLSYQNNQKNKLKLELERQQTIENIAQLNQLLENEILYRKQKDQYDIIALEIQKFDDKIKLKNQIINLKTEIHTLEQKEKLHLSFINALQSQFLNCFDQLNKLNKVVDLAKVQNNQSLNTINSIINSQHTDQELDDKMIIDENLVQSKLDQYQSDENCVINSIKCTPMDIEIEHNNTLGDVMILPDNESSAQITFNSNEVIPSSPNSIDTEAKESNSDDRLNDFPTAFDDYDDDSSSLTNLSSDSEIENQKINHTDLSDGEVGEED